MNYLPSPLFEIFFIGLLVSLALTIYRLIKGPHVLDRAMCLDVVALIVVCLMVVWELAVGTQYFFDAVLVLTIVGFISTVAIAKYLEDGDIVE
jgi:multisubunit Na+/H+ antiporter MnhF subunit